MTLVKAKSNGNTFPKLVSDFFDTDFFKSPGMMDFGGGLSKLGFMEVPSVNIAENDKDFSIEMAAPGLEKKDFKIEVDNGVLTISSEKENEEKEEKKNYSRQEYSYQSFSRSFNLPDNSLADKIEAHYENGILKLNVPKKELTVSKPKKEIKIV